MRAFQAIRSYNSITLPHRQLLQNYGNSWVPVYEEAALGSGSGFARA